jgi:hypothetical protein
MSYAVGYPSEVWSAGGYYFWVHIPFLLLSFFMPSMFSVLSKSEH